MPRRTTLARAAVLCAPLLLALTACGDNGGDEGEPTTRFGTVAEVRAYREQIDAVVQAVNVVQAEMDRKGVGSAGQATGENISGVWVDLHPQLQDALTLLVDIETPPRLTSLTEDVRALIVMRIQAYNQVMDGWKIEQAQSFAAAEPVYDEAEVTLELARALAAQVNDKLETVDLALADAEGDQVMS